MHSAEEEAIGQLSIAEIKYETNSFHYIQVDMTSYTEYQPYRLCLYEI